MDKLLNKYINLVVWRQAIIMMFAAPVPAALIKLQGMYLDSRTIAIIIIVGNIFAMGSWLLNKYCSSKVLFIGGNLISILACGGIVWMYLSGVSDAIIIVFFPIVSGLGFIFVGLASEKIKNRLKERFQEGFDIAAYSSKKSSVQSGAMIIGQGVAVGFYSLNLNIDNMEILVVLESINCIVYMIAEFQRWSLVKKLGVDD